jgi:acetylornithine deacetylase/succinyl-diaminopimelate desuccinylase-like protein
VTIDRRLLPGDDLGSATEEIRAALGDLSPYQVTVDPGVYMLPAQVDVQHPYVQALQAANVAARDREAETFYGTGTFDAGGLCARGVPAVMYGASGGDWPIGVDFVPISAVEAEAAVLAHLILSELR